MTTLAIEAAALGLTLSAAIGTIPTVSGYYRGQWVTITALPRSADWERSILRQLSQLAR